MVKPSVKYLRELSMSSKTQHGKCECKGERNFAAHITNGKLDRTRQYPYPQEANYKGSGSTDVGNQFCMRGPVAIAR